MEHLDIAFIGAGNMAGSIAGGLIAKGLPPARLHLSDANPDILAALRDRLGATAHGDNAGAVAAADVVVLAVKPQVMPAVLEDIGAAVERRRPLVISIAAGIGLDFMESRLGRQTAIVRCMPNTPALLGCGASALFANAAADDAARRIAAEILEAVGTADWVAEESQLDAVTALSGSGPAYFFLLMEAMADAAAGLGLDADSSRALACQTALGAARMAAESETGVEELRRRVTSPGGTTEAAIGFFESAGFRETVAGAMTAARDRAAELAAEAERGNA